MAKVWFRCDGKNSTMFVLNFPKEMDYVPMVGDVINTCNRNFTKATFRIKPFYNDNKNKIVKNYIMLDFKVVERRYDLDSGEWELICQPTSQSLLFNLKNVKTH
jgi:hypothetical protein